MRDTDIQWHPAFVSAMELELKKDKNKLEFHREYNLNTKPLQIDLLVIKKDVVAELSNEIGKIFKGYNIIEYKSPDDDLNIDTFYKTQAYAGLYKAAGEAVNERKAKDITVSIIRESKPVKLFKILKSENVQITMPYKGIYYISNGIAIFPTQIIVTKELTDKGHTWIKALSSNMQMSGMKTLLNETAKLKSDYEKELADSILEVTLRANSSLVEKLKGDVDVSDALLELVEPLILERERNAEQKGEQKGKILGTIDTLHSLNYSDTEIKAVIINNYNLSEEEAEKYL